MDVYVCSKAELRKFTKKVGATHILSIADPGDHVELPIHRVPKENILSMCFFGEDHIEGPKRIHVETMLDWAKRLPDDAVLVVHCWGGISRSTATALAILTQYHGDENLAAYHLLRVRPGAGPNPAISAHADAYLKRDGYLVKASNEIAEKIHIFVRNSS
jgi:predicted protein tyrosine phosphatase